ncbi:hypothetical protein GCM10010345_89740 [Streptomyces canarius]|uniref:Uncharacterized protein n=1 Tax=Streptomyces canarius TaxID=285453 RepID=A0ABQ3DGX1_9ACTN|nr:hypothetical protein GCM10010345_89740 [Streptomyces canarius]
MPASAARCHQGVPSLAADMVPEARPIGRTSRNVSECGQVTWVASPLSSLTMRQAQPSLAGVPGDGDYISRRPAGPRCAPLVREGDGDLNFKHVICF